MICSPPPTAEFPKSPSAWRPVAVANAPPPTRASARPQGDRRRRDQPRPHVHRPRPAERRGTSSTITAGVRSSFTPYAGATTLPEFWRARSPVSSHSPVSPKAVRCIRPGRPGQGTSCGVASVGMTYDGCRPLPTSPRSTRCRPLRRAGWHTDAARGRRGVARALTSAIANRGIVTRGAARRRRCVALSFGPGGPSRRRPSGVVFGRSMTAPDV